MDHEVEGPFLRSSFNYDRNLAGDDSGLDCRDPSLAKQSFVEECDINTIVRRFGVSGQLPVGVRTPSYADFEAVFDFHSAMIAIAQAGEAFDKMPGDVRARFHNSPQEFLEFCETEGNREEMRRLGLVVPEPAVVAPIAPAASSEPSVSSPSSD